MLFLLKRRWPTALATLAVLTALGMAFRHLLPDPPPIDLTLTTAALGVAACACIAVSDLLLYAVLCLLFGEAYRRRWRELVAVFHGQSLLSILSGSLMAGIGEELVFRGLASGLPYLIASAVVFGLLHHLPGRLGVFTPWSIYEGLLFAGVLYLTETLAVTMVAHFLHDAAGFLAFRYINRSMSPTA